MNELWQELHANGYACMNDLIGNRCLISYART